MASKLSTIIHMSNSCGGKSPMCPRPGLPNPERGMHWPLEAKRKKKLEERHTVRAATADLGVWSPDLPLALLDSNSDTDGCCYGTKKTAAMCRTSETASLSRRNSCNPTHQDTKTILENLEVHSTWQWFLETHAAQQIGTLKPQDQCLR